MPATSGCSSTGVPGCSSTGATGCSSTGALGSVPVSGDVVVSVEPPPGSLASVVLSVPVSGVS